MDEQLLQSFLEWARREGFSLVPEKAVAALKLALSEGPEQDHRGVTLPSRHRAGGIITPQ